MRRAALALLLLAAAPPATAAEWPQKTINWKNPPHARLEIRIGIDATQSIKIHKSRVFSNGNYHEEIRLDADLTLAQAGAYDMVAEDGSALAQRQTAMVPKVGGGPISGAEAQEMVQTGGVQQKLAECMKLESNAERQACAMAVAMGMKSKIDERCEEEKKKDPTRKDKDEGLCGGGLSAQDKSRFQAANDYDRDAYRIYSAKTCDISGSLRHFISGITETDRGISDFTHTLNSSGHKPVKDVICEVLVVIGREGTASVQLKLGGFGVVLPVRSIRDVKAAGPVTSDITMQLGAWSSIKFWPVTVAKERIGSLTQFDIARSYDGEPKAKTSSMGNSQSVQAQSRTRVTFSFRAD